MTIIRDCARTADTSYGSLITFYDKKSLKIIIFFILENDVGIHNVVVFIFQKIFPFQRFILTNVILRLSIFFLVPR